MSEVVFVCVHNSERESEVVIVCVLVCQLSLLLLM